MTKQLDGTKRLEDGTRDDVPLVAIGASAGGLEPLEKFFKAVPDDPGVAFVVVQHLSPDYRSMMNELLSRKSNLPILRIEDQMKVEPNTVYLNRPNMYVELEGDTFRTSTYIEGVELPHLPIDRFFTSLSSRDWNRTVAIVMSGSGSDGSYGAQILHEAGAAVMVQSMQEASFTSMPRSVLLSGFVDRVLDAADMPDAVQDIFTYGKKNTSSASQELGAGIKRILDKLEARHKIDFSDYKPTNVNRRIVRRLHLRGYASLDEYNQILGQSDEALNELFHDMLIGVTEFYRDLDAIRQLRNKVLNRLAAQTETNVPIKIWVAGCASGEEVYTIAIELSEALREAGSDRRFRIIGTDVHAGSIEFASRGVYAPDKVAAIPEHLRDRYFVETNGQYMVDPALRQKIIFSMHNLLNDPPFMNLDLISCRNLMIYFKEEPQASAISMFIFGLQANGYLLLGASETVGKFKSVFDIIDARWRIFQKSAKAASMVSTTSLANRNTLSQKSEPIPMPRDVIRKSIASPISELRSREMLIRSYNVLLKNYAPSSILLTPDGKVLNWFGAADAFIDTMNNLAEWTVQEIVHPDLHFAINVGIEKLRQGHFVSHVRQVTVNLPVTGPQACTVEIEAMEDGGNLSLILAKITVDATVEADLNAVVTDDGTDGNAATATVTGSKTNPKTGPVTPTSQDDAEVLSSRVHTLERDLRLTEETLQHVTERLEASGEELQASNEELQASNEELQASNEELQSSNEELHAVNEELVSVSAEHERKIGMLSELNENTELALKMLNTGVIVLDKENCIRRFSDLIERDFLLQDHDINRSVDTVGPHVDFAKLDELNQTLQEDPTHLIRKGKHKGRDLTIEARRAFLGPPGERETGAIFLFRWG